MLRWFGDDGDGGPAGREVVEGVIDAAANDGNWQIVDWKLGGGGTESRADYRQQVEEYARMLTVLSGWAAEGKVSAVPLP
jgi:ATP-dependent exoDNAse (exonuclease V) beta subunit